MSSSSQLAFGRKVFNPYTRSWVFVGRHPPPPPPPVLSPSLIHVGSGERNLTRPFDPDLGHVGGANITFGDGIIIPIDHPDDVAIAPPVVLTPDLYPNELSLAEIARRGRKSRPKAVTPVITRSMSVRVMRSHSRERASPTPAKKPPVASRVTPPSQAIKKPKRKSRKGATAAVAVPPIRGGDRVLEYSTPSRAGLSQ